MNCYPSLRKGTRKFDRLVRERDNRAVFTDILSFSARVLATQCGEERRA
jgi:hypothetical protein